MADLHPEQATFLLQMALRTLPREHETTKKVIAAIPLEKGDYRPDPVSKSALELAWHIVGAESMFLEGIIAGEFIYGRQRPETVRNSADVVSWYSERFGDNYNRLKQLSTEQLLKQLDFRGIFQNPAVMYLQTAISHSVHHRGQLSVYLRPMGAKVPSIYGESYDDAQARKATAAIKTA